MEKKQFRQMGAWRWATLAGFLPEAITSVGLMNGPVLLNSASSLLTQFIAHLSTRWLKGKMPAQFSPKQLQVCLFQNG